MCDKNSSLRPSILRRKFLAATGGVSAAAIAGCLGSGSESSPSDTETEPPDDGTEPPDDPSDRHTSPSLEKWVDEIPRPAVAEPTGTKDGQPLYEMEMQEVEQQMHRDLPPTTVWGYEGLSPGPTIEATQGEPIYVRWKNKLPDEHLLPEDTTIHSDVVPYDSTGVRTVTHLHGGNVEAASDGKAQGWFTRDFEQTGPKFEKEDYYYVNDQPPATLWYHDHSLGITRLNVYAGLAGFYLLRNEHERSLDLPEGEYEIPLALQDRSFNEDGSLYYPTGIPESERDDDESYPEPSVVPQFYGDVSVVNGKAWPRLSVEPRKYRFRLLNGANSRYYNLKLLEYDDRSGELGDDGPSFVQIGNDGGLLPKPLEIDGRLELGSAIRADVIVDFSEYAGERLLLHNDAPAKYRGRTDSESDDTVPLSEIMLVDIAESTTGEDTSQVPDTLTQVPDIPLDSVDEKRYLTLARDADEYGRPLYLLGTEEDRFGNKLTDRVTETPTVGDTELWSIANLTGMSHPMHLHLVHFQVLGRQSTGDYDPADGRIDMETLDGPKVFEQGWNDVVSVDPGDVVHLLVHFGEYEGLFNDQTGEYMWHCHMIEHEDHDMMRPLEVMPESGEEN